MNKAHGALVLTVQTITMSTWEFCLDVDAWTFTKVRVLDSRSSSAQLPQTLVLSLRCQKPRNKCQCQCPILLLPSSLCHSASWAHCSGHSSITLCHVDWRMAVHLLTMWLLQRQSSAGSKYFTSCVELSKWTHNAHGRNHFHPSRPAHASASDPTISSEAETQSYFFNFLLNKFLDQVWLTLTALCIAVKTLASRVGGVLILRIRTEFASHLICYLCSKVAPLNEN